MCFLPIPELCAAFCVQSISFLQAVWLFCGCSVLPAGHVPNRQSSTSSATEYLFLQPRLPIQSLLSSNCASRCPPFASILLLLHSVRVPPTHLHPVHPNYSPVSALLNGSRMRQVSHSAHPQQQKLRIAPQQTLRRPRGYPRSLDTIKCRSNTIQTPAVVNGTPSIKVCALQQEVATVIAGGSSNSLLTPAMPHPLHR